MNCEQTQLILSTRMDGERVGVRHAEAAAVHAEGCARCQSFARRSTLIRRSVRIRAAEPVPDLVEPIMAAVARERIRPSRPSVSDGCQLLAVSRYRRVPESSVTQSVAHRPSSSATEAPTTCASGRCG